MLKVNGENQVWEKEITLLEFITQKKLDAQKIVVEHNGSIVEKGSLEKTLIKENDRIEIVSFVGGG